MRKLMRTLFVSLLGAVCLPAYSSMITLDFNAGGGSYRYTPYYEDGFRVYPVLSQISSDPVLYRETHFDMECGLNGSGFLCGSTSTLIPDYDGTVWLGTDSTGSRVLDADGNVVRYDGCCATPHIRIDRFGSLFTVLDFQGWAGGLISSKGGVSGFGYGFNTVSVGGDLWTDIEWLELSVGFVGAPQGIDNLRVQVPEPSVLALLGFGLAGLGITRRRKQ